MAPIDLAIDLLTRIGLDRPEPTPGETRAIERALARGWTAADLQERADTAARTQAPRSHLQRCITDLANARPTTPRRTTTTSTSTTPARARDLPDFGDPDTEYWARADTAARQPAAPTPPRYDEMPRTGNLEATMARLRERGLITAQKRRAH